MNDVQGRPFRDTLALIAALGVPIAVSDVLLDKRRKTTISRIWWESNAFITLSTWTTLTAHLEFRYNWPKSLIAGVVIGSTGTLARNRSLAFLQRKKDEFASGAHIP